MVSVSFSKKDFKWAVPLVLVLVIGFGIAYTNPIPDNGHGADNIWVNFNGTERTLQSALNALSAGGFGGGSSGGSLAFGDWEDVTADASDWSVQGPAITDGFVTVYTPDWGILEAYTDSSSSPTTLVGEFTRNEENGAAFTFPVKAGDYWKVVGRHQSGEINTIHWLPIENSGPELPVCAEGDILKVTAGVWACASESGGTIVGGSCTQYWNNPGFITGISSTGVITCNTACPTGDSGHPNCLSD